MQFLARFRERLDMRWVGVQVLGFLLILLPWTFISDQVSGGVFALGAAIWVVGGVLAVVGSALALVPKFSRTSGSSTRSPKPLSNPQKPS